MKNLTLSFFKDETAATAIEYGLIAAGIAVAIIAVIQGLGTNLKNTFSSVKFEISVVPACFSKLRNRNTYPIDCANASPTVR